MKLHELLLNIAESPRNHINDLCIGFVTPDEKWSLKPINQAYELLEGIADAHIVFQGSLDALRQLFTASDDEIADYDEILRHIKILPPMYMGHLGQLMQDNLGFGINLDNHSSNNEPFSMPLRYPVGENLFISKPYEPLPLPKYDRESLPQLIADDHPEWIAMYDKSWQLAFKNLRQPEAESGFPANFIDTAFNDNTFMWDSCFMTMFGKYGRRNFDFMGTLDNFYAKQHADGYICREINTYAGYDLFRPQDARSTGPNIMPWSEWCDFAISSDKDRLHAVFPALVAYYLWWKDWRTWPDGSYWTSGLGSGMDNQTRVPDSHWHHRHHSWVDATMQQALNCRLLLRIADIIDRHDFDEQFEAEYDFLSDYINNSMWDEDSGFYYDVAPDGQRVNIMSIGAYWGLFAGVIPEDRAQRMIGHLQDPELFNRPHRVPSQAANSADGGYRADGGYWLGGVWTPTNYMVLQALTERQDDDLAYEIARNHVANVVEVFQNTGTLWENYAPESASPGNPARGDFVGWTGVSAIAIPIEYLIGLRPQAGDKRLLWDVRLLEKHGVKNYPMGSENTVDLICNKRLDTTAAPTLLVKTDDAFQLEVRWDGQSKTFELVPGEHRLEM